MLRLRSFSGGQLPEGSNHRRMAIQLYVAGYGVSVTASAPIHCIQYSIGDISCQEFSVNFIMKFL